MKLRKWNIRVRDCEVNPDVVVDIKTDMPLAKIIQNDILYGVGTRPTLPSCFEDDSELSNDGVDPLSDMRHDSWHDAAEQMNPQFGPTVETTIENNSVDVNVETPPADADTDN